MTMSQENKTINFSRLFTYYMARKMQGRVGQKGTEIRMVLSAMQTYGVPEERYWPFGYNRVDIEPSIQSIREAESYKLQAFGSARTEYINSCIDANTPVVVGIYTGRMFWALKGPLDKQVYKPVNSTDNRESYGHAVTIVGYDDSLHDGAWIIANSLGLKWGDHGYGILPYSCAVDIGEAFVLHQFAGISPGRKISAN
jgi:C1A family cysteine protease